MTAFLPTLKQLQYLVALNDHGHFGKAATACFVTQSTLSAGIRELESLLGVTIVERTRRVVRFSPMGERMVEKARAVLREAEDLTAMAQAAGRPLSGELRLSVIPTIAPFLLPRILPKLRKDWPELQLYLREETSSAAVAALHKGQVDCVLLALPFPVGDVISEILFDDSLLLALPESEAPKSGAIDVSTIDAKRLLLLEDGHCLKDHALAACSRPEARAEARMLGTSLHTLVQMVDNGLGITLLPAMALEAGLLSGTNIRAVPLDSDDARRRIALIWRKGSPREKDFQLLSEAVRGLAQPERLAA